MNITIHQHDKMIELGIPLRMCDAIVRYYENGLPPGDFLTAVISNDLRGAIERADDENVHLLKNYIMWFYNYAPGGSWGSPENMMNWLKQDFTEEEVA